MKEDKEGKIVKTVSNFKGFEMELPMFEYPICGNSSSPSLKRPKKFICLDDGKKEKITTERENIVSKNRKMLDPLYSIYMEQNILREVLIRTSIPEIITKNKPIFNGVILYGKGGTGKTVLQRAIAKVYENAGAISQELNLAALSEKFIGSLSNNLDEKIREVL